MSVFARIAAGAVAELFALPAGCTLNQCFHPTLAQTFVDVTAVTPAPEPGWSASEAAGVWSFMAPAPLPPPTPAQQAELLLLGGLKITSSATPALSATYPADQVTQSKLLAIRVALGVSGGFPGGVTTWPVKDVTGAWHSFTAAQYTALAEQIAIFVAGCDLVIDGQSTTLPATSATIP